MTRNDVALIARDERLLESGSVVRRQSGQDAGEAEGPTANEGRMVSQTESPDASTPKANWQCELSRERPMGPRIAPNQAAKRSLQQRIG